MTFEETAKEGLTKLISGVKEINISARSPYELMVFSEFYNEMGYEVKSPKASGGISYPINLTIKNKKESINYNA